MRTINEAGLTLIMGFESYRSDWYLDAAGIKTCGFGHTGPLPEGFSAPLSLTEAERLLLYDLQGFEWFVETSVKVKTSDNQFAALTSFCYNVGSAAFEGSTLLRHLNDRAYELAADQFLRWVYARDPRTGQKRILRGLQRRREAERALFLTPEPEGDFGLMAKAMEGLPPEPIDVSPEVPTRL